MSFPHKELRSSTCHSVLTNFVAPSGIQGSISTLRLSFLKLAKSMHMASPTALESYSPLGICVIVLVSLAFEILLRQARPHRPDQELELSGR